eukprot:5525894-Amphidinium_carterae.1
MDNEHLIWAESERGCEESPTHLARIKEAMHNNMATKVIVAPCLANAKEKATVWARWGAVSMERHQPCIVSSNAFNRDAEPKTLQQSLPLDAFLKMTEGMFHPLANYEDIRAVLKRCNVVVFGVENVYIQVACHTAAPTRGLGCGGGGGVVLEIFFLPPKICSPSTRLVKKLIWWMLTMSGHSTS